MLDNNSFYRVRRTRLTRIMSALSRKYGFSLLGLDSRDTYLKYQNQTRISCRSFLSQFAYAQEDDILICEDKELKYLYLLCLDDENTLQAYPPLGDYRPEAFASAVRRLRDIFVMAGYPLKFMYVDETELSYFSAVPGEKWVFSSDPDDDDYVYDVRAYTDFDGPQNSHRRRDLNQFLRRHEAHIEPINAKNIADCVKVADGWCLNRDCGDCAYRCPKKTALRALDKLDMLHALHCVMYVDGKSESMVILGRMGGGMVDLLTIFTRMRESGLQYFLMDRLCREIMPDVKYINYEEDLGIERLRRFKKSMRPTFMVKKYSVTPEE